MKNELLSEEGIVKSAEGSSAVVEIINPSGCEECGARMFCKADESGTRTIKLDNPGLILKPGDRIRIETEGRNLIVFSVIFYLIPLVILILSLIISDSTIIKSDNKDLYVAGISILTVILYYFIVYLFGVKLKIILPSPKIKHHKL